MINENSKLKYHQTIALLLVFFAFFMSALVSRTVFERMPHLEDEVTYLFQARIFARGDVVIETPQPRQSYWQPFVVDYSETGKRFSKYSPGWSALLAIGVNMGQTWIINAFCGMLSVALVYRLGREIYNPDAGIIAAALLAFSPMALLLNASLMGHTSALFFFTSFMYAYWRTEKTQNWLWGVVAGFALGLLVINRPLTAIGVTVPFIVWSGFKVLWAAYQDSLILYHKDRLPAAKFNYTLWKTLRPLLILGAITLFFAIALPFYNNAATGEPEKNLYTLVWPYDQAGFGECCGRHGHTIVKGMNHSRWDLSLMAADLFGWQIANKTTPDFWVHQSLPIESTFSFFARSNKSFIFKSGITLRLRDHLRTESDYWPLIGLSFFILPFGLWAGFRKWWMRGWLLIALWWLVMPLLANSIELQEYIVRIVGDLSTWLPSNFRGNIIQITRDVLIDFDFLKTDSEAIWRWLKLGALWMLLPGAIFVIVYPLNKIRKTSWTWLLLGVVVGLVGLQLAYWIGSQRYSTRYYYEALSALALIAALPIAWLARWENKWIKTPIAWLNPHLSRLIVYSIFAVVLLWSLDSYSTPRINALRRFNFISPELPQEIEKRRVDDSPVLVIVTAAPDEGVLWRSYGSLMVVTSPYLDSDIVVARDSSSGGSMRQQIIDRFPDRQIIELQAAGNTWCFPENLESDEDDRYWCNK
jgi:hypothetical protein